MSGLIWSGIGQGIAGAGQAFAGSIMKDIEYQRLLEAEQRREESALKRLEEADRIKAERTKADAEELKQRVIRDTQAASKEAERIASFRQSQAFDRLAQSSLQAGAEGDVSLSKEQLAGVTTPSMAREYRGMGLIDEKLPLTRQEKLIQAADDELQGALNVGAHSSVIEAIAKKREAVLKQIVEENKETRETRRLEQQDRRLSQQEESLAMQGKRTDALIERMLSQNRTDQQRADAATTTADASKTRAERPSATVRGQEYRTQSDFTIRERTLRTQIGKAFGEEKTRLQGELDELLDARKTWEAGRSTAAPSTAPAVRPATPGAASTTSKSYSNLWK